MKKLLGLLCCGLISFHAFSQDSKDGGIAIIPEPVKITKTPAVNLFYPRKW